MSAELQDYRGRITAETHCALEAEACATGRDRQEIVREILHEWSMRRIHAASVMHSMLRAQGLAGIDGGARGNPGESKG